MTREVFRAARPWLNGHPPLEGVAQEALPPLAYRSYQQYVFKGVVDPMSGRELEPIEIFEIGAPGRAKLEAPPGGGQAGRFRQPGDDAVSGWRPGTGNAIPGREDWKLEKFLGEGGFGEVWLAHKKRGNEHRVFKFCFEASRIKSFLREEKFFHLLKEELRSRNDIVPVRDVQLAEKPYFVAYDYYPAGSLLDWARTMGGGATAPAEGGGRAQEAEAERRGMALLPHTARLSLFVQTARAAGAAHSLGIIHKDIKPGNILVNVADPNCPQILLGDFGLGVLDDLSRLERIGHSGTGFSGELIAKNESTRTGSRMYAAPEYLQGRPASVQGDVYALGVLLYQLAVGDLERPLAPGWEKQITDPFLRADIAAAVDGDTTLRLRSADELADRVVNLEVRRRAAADQVAEAARAARRQRTLRIALYAAAILTAVSAATAWGLFRALEAEQKERDARSVAEHARTSAEGLINDMLYDLKDRLEPIGRLDLLASVSDSANRYFDRLKDAPALSGGLPHLQRALALASAGEIAVFRGDSTKARSVLTDSLATLHRLAASGGGTDRPKILSAMAIAASLQAKAHGRLGSKTDEEKVLREALAVFEGDKSAGIPLSGHAALYESLGDYYYALKDYREAESSFRRFLELQSAAAETEQGNLRLQQRRVWAMTKLARALASQEKGEAAEELRQSAEGLAAKLYSEHPENREFLHDQAMVTGDRAESLAAAGDVSASRSAYSEYLAKMEELTRHDPTNTKWQFHLSNACVELADVTPKATPSHSATGSAKDHLARAITIREQLVRLDPKNLQWHESLYKARKRLLSLLVADSPSSNDPDRSATILTQSRLAMESCNLLASLQPEDPAFQLARVQMALTAGALLAKADRQKEALGILDAAIADAARLPDKLRESLVKYVGNAVKLRDEIKQQISVSGSP